MKHIVSISMDSEDRQFLADNGWKISNFVHIAIQRYKQWTKEIENLQWLIAKIKEEKLKQDINKERIQRLISALNQIPADEKHPLINDLALCVIATEKTLPELAEILQKINDNLKKVKEENE